MLRFFLAFSSCIVMSLPCGAALAQEIELPNEDLRNFLRSLSETPAQKPDEFDVFVVETPLPRDSVFYTTREQLGRMEQALQPKREMTILLEPQATPEVVRQAIEEFDFEVLEHREEIGFLRVRLPSAGGGGTAAAMTVDGIVSSAQDPLIARLENHPAILEATPNTVQSPFQIASSKYPLPRIGMNAGAGETVDWGMVDAKLDQLWPRVTSPGLAVGIIDVGFDDHEDILMQKGLQQDLTVDDHGNHVAGIACAKHDNLLGIRGAAPRCTARVAVGSFLFPVIDPIESDGPLGFHTLFSELVSTVLDFINQNNDVAVINLSLGYNWMPNFGINPEDNGMEAVRDLVRGQGRVMLSILEYARRNDVIIVSAAGNDSSELGANPLGAQWASPFNWAALAMKEMRGWSNGIVVEAHDRAGQRAAFSNDEGSVSAPGVRIFSALAGAPNRYGEMSGTSMASPLVSGGVALLRDVRPDLTLEQVYQCILSGPVTSSSSTPKVDFLQAADQC